MENDYVVCSCLGTTVGDLKKAIEDGASSFEEVQEVTNIGNICGVCMQEAREIVEELLQEK